MLKKLAIVHLKVLLIYLAAVTNELRSSRGLAHLTAAEIKGFTLETLGVTYKEAYSAVWCHLNAAIESSMTGEYRKAAERAVKGLRQ